MQESTEKRHQPSDRATKLRLAAAGQFTLSDKPSAKAMDMPTPTAAAKPTKNAVRDLCVANAVAKFGASVETEPSISPASAGCTNRKMNAGSSLRTSLKAKVRLRTTAI